ncbi:hypothetical protein C8A03DRAFT_35761 [Achaetomium macrosporum]|uniref:Major facilitator superfamily (MFS) profile domain-containing protein n=1 Tax=Achaetomium macrosporum TaxID=79813 RepID=A0AAN7C7H1_9PEZI|nr:hypothetical protein C8A03DRAFT_35761 [Achaetomium macrosporum]
MKKFLGLRGQALNLVVGIIAGCDFLLFGYDQGVMGGMLTLQTFLDTFPMINPGVAGLSPEESSTRSTYQGIAVASYNLGCFLGSLLTTLIGNPLGRKRVIMLGTSIMVVGAILQASATTPEQFIVGRIITGLGNGGNTSTVPTSQSETSKAHKRGKMVMIEGALITCSIMVSYWIDLGLSFAPGSVAWRFPLAFQIVFCIVIITFIPVLPESPRWLILKGPEAEAREVVAALEGTEDTSHHDTVVENEVLAIKETVAEMSKGTFADLFTVDDHTRNLHRTLLAYFNQQGLGMSDFLSRLLAAVNGTEYFVASWPAVFLVERAGRRKLMLFGAVGQAATMAVLAGVNSRGPDGDTRGCRSRGSANWIFNFLVVMITPLAFNNIGYRTYVIFAVINAFMVPCVYFFYPETAYRLLEEMDSIFHKARVEPRWYGKHGELLVDCEQTVENRRHVLLLQQSDGGLASEKSSAKVGDVAVHEEHAR